MKSMLSLVALALCGPSALASDKLIIVSPHRKSIQDEYLPAFKDFYLQTYKTQVEVEWLDNGGTTDAVRLVRTRFAGGKPTAGIDLLWGGGNSIYIDLGEEGFLARYDLPPELAKQIPQQVAGQPLFDQSHTWVASAMSSFGIFFNRKMLAFEHLKEPATWADLAAPEFKNQLALADPRHSGTALTMVQIVVNALGWDQGWEQLTKIAGNTRSFSHSSSDPIKAVVSGDAAASMAVDFYAQPKLDELGPANLGFVLPAKATILDPDPIAVLRGAPNPETARRFMAFVLSVPGQKLLILPKGAPGGPVLGSLGRMAINKQAYQDTEGKRLSPFNPFQQAGFMALDYRTSSKTVHLVSDLVGAVLIDPLPDLKAAWAKVIKRGLKADEVKEFAAMPVSAQELLALVPQWHDNTVRNAKINAWLSFAKAKYKRLAER